MDCCVLHDLIWQVWKLKRWCQWGSYMFSVPSLLLSNPMHCFNACRIFLPFFYLLGHFFFYPKALWDSVTCTLCLCLVFLLHSWCLDLWTYFSFFWWKKCKSTGKLKAIVQGTPYNFHLESLVINIMSPLL